MFGSCFRSGWYQWGDCRLWLVEFGCHPVWTPNWHGESKPLLLRCYQWCVGVLAPSSITLSVAAPGCVFACVSMCRLLVGTMFPWEARLGFGLLPWFPGTTRGVGVTFRAPSAGSVGHLSLGVLRWLPEQRWDLTCRSEVGEEGEDRASSQGAKPSGPVWGSFFQEEAFCSEYTSMQANYNFTYLKDKNAQ